MSSIAQTLVRLAEDGSLVPVAESAQGDDGFLTELAGHLVGIGRAEDAAGILRPLLARNGNLAAARLAMVRAMDALGRIDDALEQLIAMRDANLVEGEYLNEVQKHLLSATELYGQCLETGELARAARLVNLLSEMCPQVGLFQEAQAEVRTAQISHHRSELARLEEELYDKLHGLAAGFQEKREVDKELRYRLQLFEHPRDQTVHSAIRLNNIALAVSRVLGAHIDHIDENRRELARVLLRAGQATPPSPYGDFETDSAARFDRFYRLLLASVDVDAAFGPPPEPIPFLPISLHSSTGEPLEVEQVVEFARANKVRAAFTSQSSPEFFARYGRTYISSILKASDVSAMVFVVVCTPRENLKAAIADLDIDDPRVVICNDDFDLNRHPVLCYSPTEAAPRTTPSYYGVAALLRVDFLLEHLQVPVFVTGIDTVLQRGVSDLLDRYGDTTDLALNKHGPEMTMGSQIVNNLELFFPTANARMFLEYLKVHLLPRIIAPHQAQFQDQLDIQMAKHHVMTNGTNPVIHYFDEFDINNLMFNQDNYRHHLDLMRSYRFLNMFIGGNPKNALTSQDVD